MKAIHIPETFAKGVLAERGDAGRAWLDTLPNRFTDICTRWNLEIDGAPAHGHLGIVIPVLSGNEKLALKITWADETSRNEIVALQTWNGQGAVKLFNALPDDGILLLERLNSTQTLEDVPIEEAIRISGNLLRRLTVPAPNTIPKLAEHAINMSALMEERWQKFNKPFPANLLKAAQETAAALAPSCSSSLVNYDLHYGNILAGEREPWLVIDPKALAGDPEYAVWPLLFCRAEGADDRAGFERRFDALVAAAQVDPDRARGWSLVKTVDYWLWALSIGLTEDPKRCALMAQWLSPTTI